MFSSIQIQTMDMCNRRCSFCPNKMDIRKTGGRLPAETFGLILDQLKELGFSGSIKPFLQNEPLLDPRFPELVAKIRRMFPHNVISINTNGDGLNEPALRDVLVQSGIDGLQVNCYGGENLWDDRRLLVENWAKGTKALRLHGSGSFRDLEARNGSVNIWLEWIPQALPNFWNRGGSVRHIKPERPSWTFDYCNLIFKQMYINHKGQAILCCGDWKHEIVLGRVDKTPLGAIWEGPVYRHYRRRHRGRIIDDLRLCGTCNRVRHLD